MENLKEIDLGSVAYQKTGCRTMFEIIEFIKIQAENGLKDKTLNQYASINQLCETVIATNKMYE